MYWRTNIIENNNQNYFWLDVKHIFCLRFILADKEATNSENKDFIKDLKKISTQEMRWFIVFDKKDVTLKIDINEVKMKMTEQVFYSKIDTKINYKIKPADIICILEHIPNNLAIRLETNSIYQIIKMMKSKTRIQKLKEQDTKFLLKGIEIEPRIIESKQDEED